MNQPLPCLVLFCGTLILSSSLHAQPSPVGGPPPQQSFIELTASAEKEIPNKIATAEISVTARGKDPALVEKALSELSGEVIAAVNRAGGKNSKSEAVNLTPETVMEGNKPKVVSYEGRASVVTESSPEKIGDVIKAAFEAGGDQLGNVSLRPEKSEMDETETELMKQAVAQAMQQAQAIAQQMGAKPSGQIEVIMEQQNPPFFPRPMMAMAGMARANIEAASMPVEGGSTKLQRSAHVKMGIIPATNSSD